MGDFKEISDILGPYVDPQEPSPFVFRTDWIEKSNFFGPFADWEFNGTEINKTIDFETVSAYTEEDDDEAVGRIEELEARLRKLEERLDKNEEDNSIR